MEMSDGRVGGGGESEGGRKNKKRERERVRDERQVGSFEEREREKLEIVMPDVVNRRAVQLNLKKKKKMVRLFYNEITFYFAVSQGKKIYFAKGERLHDVYSGSGSRGKRSYLFFFSFTENNGDKMQDDRQ